MGMPCLFHRGCNELLSEIKPGMHTDDFSMAVDKLMSAGIDVSVNIIVGIGGHLYQERHVTETIQYLRTLPVGVKIFFSPLMVSEKCGYVRQEAVYGRLTAEEMEVQCEEFMMAVPCSEYIFVPV